jgi:hypothetical protein
MGIHNIVLPVMQGLWTPDSQPQRLGSLPSHALLNVA